MAAGDVSITLDGKPFVLRSTLGAAETVNAAFGSFTAAYERVGKFDFSAFVVIIAAGTDKPTKEIKSAVFKNGMTDLVKPISEYLTLLSNGGRPATEAEGDDKGEA